ncbi:TetR/AcrR family transcriptional regulator [Stigmatella aurantiaca]|uniref:Putative transcriptional regulator n=1 Tax=Stigmatella aurantiaca (strain DW4/3-1) TaxID=378806 RepID=Q08XK7_STIAD|nr:TetR/AcrR family transcriptional regulator [Stigmatella aurantiaca]ADO70538.1 transcriptional regulator, TetR-like protein [Stigmatella aurantiaca DW4/3-1]EAU65219.1 putative transcriptional regulator [Stigmatella aurantiaca DW4/3-1]
MARVKEFDRDEALDAAIVTFAAHGFAGTSTETLLEAMGIGRQSMYDTFGDKRQLYLAALRKYGSDSVSEILALLDRATSPLAGMEAVLRDFARNPRRLGMSSCLGVSSICEFGRSDRDIAAINDEFGKLLEHAFETRARAAIEAGEVDETLNAREVAHYLSTTLCGMKVAAEGGASSAQLAGVVRMTLRSLAR